MQEGLAVLPQVKIRMEISSLYFGLDGLVGPCDFRISKCTVLMFAVASIPAALAALR